MSNPEPDPDHSREELKDLSFGPHEVNFVDNFILDLNNGEKLSINIWFPSKTGKYFQRQAAVVQYCQAQDETFEPEVLFTLTLNEENLLGEGDGTACVVVNQQWTWLFTTCQKNIFQYTNSQFYICLTTAQVVW